ncbi:MAG: ribonuclease III [Rhodocyclaceae bacterium]|nr:MAG: ribonuclease III [Rhodocyclaceae bacterium]
MKLVKLEQSLGYTFSRPELLAQALTHRSFGSPNNERLEFLGDSVLNCTIAALLFDKFPQTREGDLSRFRAGLVKQDTLASLAQQLNLGDALRLGEGELKSGGFRRPSILADALEAIFGAIYLDGGFDQAVKVITRLYQALVEDIDPKTSAKDAKTALQEYLQSKHYDLPRYRLKSSTGEAHAQTFEVECEVPELHITTLGQGASRRIAEQEAARQALPLAIAQKQAQQKKN